jgi:2-amino-4-hydroxy-6-hydroxymethyldihydropteridine diphosphokinase
MLREPVTAYVGLGANLGDPAAAVRQALTDLGHLPHTRLLAASDLYRTAPHEAQGPDFINAVAAVQTHLTAPDLLVALQGLEQAAGRERPWHHAPRTLDLDLLIYGDARIDSPALTVPHPRWTQRAFVLVPLAQVAPQCVTPEQLSAVAMQPLVRWDGR